ncbi:hypothetical protein Vqi01_52920 [Micromonospora qiuiae]|uniref:HEAT repeat domain-containing protein n=1 Tax=Micromonospora qiuiae TaxID=502268 RepID=A0ABQ4JHN9_9ACTN|nr:hypothetical protein [Micromonospora qiuiae]GIJ30130.1 hypothetical protein Vqi01_52920 [Micromonospora qiuiae]
MNLFEPARTKLASVPGLQYAANTGAGNVYQAFGDQTIYLRDMLRGGGVLDSELGVVRNNALFAKPANHAELKTVVSDSSVLVLVGQENSGKRTTALCVLYEWTQEDKSPEAKSPALTELFVDWEKPSVGDLPTAPRTAYLLDLGGEVNPLPDRFGRELVSYADRLKSVGSCMVITVTEKSWEVCARINLPFGIDHEPPPVADVLQKHLAALTSDADRLAWAGNDLVLAALSSFSEPEAAVRLAKKMASRSVRTFGEVQVYLEEFMRWPAYIRKEFRNSREVPHRALLLTLAVVGRQTTGVITSGQHALLAALRADFKPEISIGQPDIEGRLAELEVDLIDGHAYLDRNKPGLGRTVVRHVWLNYWDLHSTLLDWMAGLPSQAGEKELLTTRVASAVVNLASDVKDPSIIELVAKTAELSTGRRDLATEILRRAIAEPELSQFTRELLLRWSKSKSAGNQLSVLSVCKGDFGISYPGYALTRLRWLLLSEDSTVAEEAAQTLRWLAVNVSSRDLVLQALVAWLGQNGGVQRAGKKGIRALLSPEPDYVGFLDSLVGGIVSQSPLESSLKAGWLALLTDADFRVEATLLVQEWATAIAAGTLREQPAYALLFQVTQEAAKRDISVLEALIDPDSGSLERDGALYFRQLRRQVLRAVFGRRGLQAEPFRPALKPAGNGTTL